jgi:hypothetical protein
LLVCCGSSGPGRIETWDVTNPAAPFRRKLTEFAQTLFYLVIANGRYYVGNRGGEQELLTVDPSFLF